MKLYTEADVRQMLEDSDEVLIYYIDSHMEKLTPIELPSDEEIESKAEDYTDKFVATALFAFEDGAKWMRDKIQGGNNEQQ